MKHWLVSIGLLASLACALPSLAAEWVGTWGAAPLPPTAAGGPFPPTPSFSNQTIRQVVRVSVGGERVRIRFTNEYGTKALTIGAAHVALADATGAVQAGTDREILFSGKPGALIPAGAPLLSDPVALPVKERANLSISLFLPEETGPCTCHDTAMQSGFVSDSGNFTKQAFKPSQTIQRRAFLSGVEVESAAPAKVVVAFGDSITDGYHSSTGTYTRWPDFLARRLAAGPGPQQLSVVDAGIGGNRVLTDVPNLWQGVSALKRFGHDALGQPGVSDVILMEGINDIGNNAGPNGAPLTAQDLIDGYRALISQAHAAHVRIIGATLMPILGNGYYTPAAEELRQSVNQWIRTGGAFDGVVDFDATMRDLNNIAALNPVYDSGDHIHPNDLGMQAMANAVDLRLLRS